MQLDQALKSFTDLNEEATKFHGTIRNALASVESFSDAWNSANSIVQQSVKVLNAMEPATSAVSFAIEAVRGKAATLREAIKYAFSAFGPFLVGGAIALGLAAIVAAISYFREQARLAKVDIGSITDPKEAEKVEKYWTNQVKGLRNLQKISNSLNQMSPVMKNAMLATAGTLPGVGVYAAPAMAILSKPVDPNSIKNAKEQLKRARLQVEIVVNPHGIIAVNASLEKQAKIAKALSGALGGEYDKNAAMASAYRKAIEELVAEKIRLEGTEESRNINKAKDIGVEIQKLAGEYRKVNAACKAAEKAERQRAETQGLLKQAQDELKKGTNENVSSLEELARKMEGAAKISSEKLAAELKKTAQALRDLDAAQKLVADSQALIDKSKEMVNAAENQGRSEMELTIQAIQKQIKANEEEAKTNLANAAALNEKNAALRIQQAELEKLDKVQKLQAKSQPVLEQAKNLLKPQDQRSEIDQSVSALDEQIQNYRDAMATDSGLSEDLKKDLEEMEKTREALKKLKDASLAAIKDKGSGDALEKELKQQELLAKASGKEFNKNQAEYEIQQNIASEYTNKALKEGKSVEEILNELGPTFARIDQLKKTLGDEALASKIKSTEEGVSEKELARQAWLSSKMAEVKGESSQFDEKAFKRAALTSAVESISKDMLAAGKSFEEIEAKIQPLLDQLDGLKKSDKPAWETFKENLGKMLGNMGQAVLQKLPMVQNVMGAVKQGAEMGGPYGAVAMGLFALIQESETFQQLLSLINPILQAVANAAGAILEPLLPIFAILSSVLMPILNVLATMLANVLAPAFQILFPIIKLLGLGILAVYRGIAWAYNGIVKAINWALGWLGVNLKPIDTDALDESLSSLADLTWEGAMAQAKLADETNKASEAMRNVPSGFKATLERFRIAEPAKPSTSSGITDSAVATSPLDDTGYGGSAVFPGDRGNRKGETQKRTDRQNVEVHVHFEGEVYGFDDFERRVTEAVSKAELKRGMARLGLGTAGAY